MKIIKELLYDYMETPYINFLILPNVESIHAKIILSH
jgi:hypothetical protein